MDFETDRRQFLELAGTGTALSLAGCSALQDDAAQQTTTTGAGESGDGSRRVAVTVQPDQQKLQQRRQEIQSELSSGNVSRSEAQQQYQTAQQELLTQAVDSFRQRADSTSNLSVVGAVEQFGIILIAGAPAALIDSLSFETVNALLPQETFQQAKSQAQQGSGTGTAGSGASATAVGDSTETPSS
ncbi:hypothetical protein NDI76_16545 [Halogeometricum sp. S1BR25-6]|uniref:Uncharacterized protein n=1 Tax=Halogeometricum salsisoli TaxID=2950536 RepID=A0ABU2GHS4_9EURY|nr:hypothetical protein [Halogeometricum sp. S1BR25-6]MDS0300357.1 hypothetical protein [Halogeometricum sp. S1BR25-6]